MSADAHEEPDIFVPADIVADPADAGQRLPGPEAAVPLHDRADHRIQRLDPSSAERGDRPRKLGATHVLDRAGQGGEDAPPGYDVIIDIAAGATMPSFFARLNPNGRMVVAGYPPADFGMTMMAALQKSLLSRYLGWHSVWKPASCIWVANVMFSVGG